MTLLQQKPKPSIGYFSMEIAVDPKMPTYSGGLGILAGDTLRSAADLGLPMVAVTLLHRKGYFTQKIRDERQLEEPAIWPIDDFLKDQSQRISVRIQERSVSVRAWEYRVVGLNGHVVPVYFLDTDLPENSPWDRTLTDFLYGGDSHYRLCQEVVLGIGGLRMLRALGLTSLRRFHMNEGHASLLALELLDEQAKAAGRTRISHEDIEAVRKLCVFTTHTPVAAGHDKFSLEEVERVLGRKDFHEMKEVFCCEGLLNMTYLALNLSHYVNGVAKRHGQVSQHMFARYSIDSITNGVHAATWAAPEFQALFNDYIPGWRHDNFSLRYALSLPRDQVWRAHLACKARLIDEVRRRTGVPLDSNAFTIGFARRAATYKRADLLFHDLGRLKAIAKAKGPFQIVYAGKAHPQDLEGKELIRRVIEFAGQLQHQIRVVYLENYDFNLGRIIAAGSDLWLNTPEPPLEASGTSGMKAALNGVPSLSVLDGWWIEGCIEGITGWSIGGGPNADHARAKDAAALYEKLGQVILPMFHDDQSRYLDVMRHAMALNGSFFNTQRMMLQYVQLAYF